MDIKIPVYQPTLLGNEKKYVNECLDSTWISSKGKFIPKFEQGFAKYIDIKHATTVSNGTLAIHLALLALGIGAGDEVIVPTLTYIASANAIAYTGAKPIFVDSLADTWQMDPNDVLAKITPNTRAIMAVHLYGHPCDMQTLKAICKQYDLFLIEDCAEAIGSLYKNQHVGTFGDVATFSFFGNKTITTGEGGMLVTNNHYLYERAIHFKGQGLDKDRQYWHDVIGYNYRMTNICAAIGLAQLEQINSFLFRKIEIADLYRAAFKDSDIKFHDQHKDVHSSYWMCSVLVAEASQRDLLCAYLASKGIETRPFFYPVHTMPMYAIASKRHIVAEDLGLRGINLPSYPSITNEQIKFITDSVFLFLEYQNWNSRRKQDAFIKIMD